MVPRADQLDWAQSVWASPSSSYIPASLWASPWSPQGVSHAGNDLTCDDISNFASTIYQHARGPGEVQELIVSGNSLAELVMNFKDMLAEAAASRDFTLLLLPHRRFEM